MKNILTVLLLLCIACSGLQTVYCETGPIVTDDNGSEQNYQQIEALSDTVYQNANERIEPVKNVFVTICYSVFSISATVFIILLIWSRKDESISKYLKTLGTVVTVTLIISLIANGTINQIIERILISLGY